MEKLETFISKTIGFNNSLDKMTNRKLQVEVERTFKKVNEGLDEFDQLLDKVNSTPSQREKFEAELKKEIKKLQRLREQIRGWIASGEFKDKNVLQDYRRKIEQRMETFKVVERESKLKAFSKEALSKAHQLKIKKKKKQLEDDPKVNEAKSYLQDRMETLKEQLTIVEEELEGLKEKHKKGQREYVERLEKRIETLKKNYGKLEQIYKRLDSGKISHEDVMNIQDGIDYLVDSNEQPDFLEDEYLFDGLIVDGEEEEDEEEEEEDEEFEEDIDISSPIELEVTDPVKEPLKQVEIKKEEKVEPKKEDPKKIEPKKEEPKKEEPKKEEPKKIEVKKVEEPKIEVKQTIEKPVENKSQPSINPQVKNTSNTPNKVFTPSQNVNPVPNQTLQNTNPVVVPPKTKSSSPQELPIQIIESGKKNKKKLTQTQPVQVQQPTIQTQPTTQTQPTIQIQPTLQTQPAIQTQPTIQPQKPVVQKIPSYVEITKSQEESKISELNDDQNNDETFGDNLESLNSLEDISTQTQDYDKNTETDQSLRILNSSLKHIPYNYDSERPKPYVPLNPYTTPDSFTTKPLPIFNDPSLFEKMDVDTLFFIFYYQQGTYQQYLAGKELKKQAWRYHKKYLTWFQRHDQPSITTNEYELGTYVYFDYETDWCQRIKSGFRFEYEYLEDELHVT